MAKIKTSILEHYSRGTYLHNKALARLFENKKAAEALLDISEEKPSQALLNKSGIKLGGFSFGNMSEALLNISGIKLCFRERSMKDFDPQN